MTISHLPYHLGQSHLLPPSVGDWLPEGRLACFIGDTVESLDLSALHARYAGGDPRNQPFHSAMMVKVSLYGYATVVLSSRRFVTWIKVMMLIGGRYAEPIYGFRGHLL
jgi:hypothetical protein